MEHAPTQAPEPERRRARHLADKGGLDIRVEAYLDQYGDAWNAFLTLPGVKPSDPEVFDLFEESYIGSYRHDRGHVLENVTEYASVRDHIRQIAANAGWPDAVVRIDIDDLWHATQEVLFDIVDYDNENHVFGK